MSWQSLSQRVDAAFSGRRASLDDVADAPIEPDAMVGATAVAGGSADGGSI